MPFLENVVRGRPVSRERLLEVARHYDRCGGKSPINGQCRALIGAVRAEMATRGRDLPVYWGNRNWHPLLPAAMREMSRDGVRRAIAFVTSAFGSYSGCRQYLDDIEAARASLGGGAPEVDKIRPFFNHPGFVEAMADRVRTALARLGRSDGSKATVLYTAHSIPLSMAASCRYVEQLREAARLTSDLAGATSWKLVFQSRSGPPAQPWLAPDVCESLREAGRTGLRRVCVAPIGFLSDHIEVLFDLDVEAAEVAREAGLEYARAGTVGIHPRFVAGVCDLIGERLAVGAARASAGRLPPLPDVCPPGCCPKPERPRPRSGR